MNDTAAAAAAAAAGGCRQPFTAAQWQELEQQALIFKYMMAGIPVPPELLLPIRKNLEMAAARFYHHPTVVYCSLYGKKLDPEPWRCRRTDGKKWRCSKNAYPDSKYCERHMHRGRNRSRKPVETQNLSQFKSSMSSASSAVTTLAPSTGGVSSGCGGGGTGSFPGGIPLQSSLHSGAGSSASRVSCTGSSLSQPQADPGFQGRSSRDYRYPCGEKCAVDEHNFLSEASGSASSMGINSSADSAWHVMPVQVSYSLSKPKNGSLLQGCYPQLQSMQDLGHETVSSLSKQQLHQQHSFFGTEFDLRETEGSQPLRSFFNEWPNTRDSWSNLEDDRYNRTSFSTTQLSISLPMASSDFSTTSPRSPNGDD